MLNKIYNLSSDNTENIAVKKGIDESNITIIAGTINKPRIVSSNNVETTTNDDHQRAIAPPNNHHTSTDDASQKGDKVENTLQKKKSKFRLKNVQILKVITSLQRTMLQNHATITGILVL